MKLWLELLELVMMTLITFAVVIGSALLVGYLLGRVFHLETVCTG